MLLNKLYPISHFFRLKHFPDELQRPNQLANGALLLMVVSDAGMFDIRGVKPQEIAVAGANHPALRVCEINVNRVIFTR